MLEEMRDVAAQCVRGVIPLAAGRRKSGGDAEWDDPDALAEDEYDDLDDLDDEEEDLDDFDDEEEFEDFDEDAEFEEDEDRDRSLDELEEEEEADETNDWES